MENLRTDFLDDVLNTSENTRRKFRTITNDDGTISFEDVTAYSQVGDSFGAADVNKITGAVNELNESLVGVNGKKIEFGTITIANGASDITFGEFESNPTVVAIARASGTPAFITCVVQSTTQARLYVWNAATGALLNSSMTVDWVAVGNNN